MSEKLWVSGLAALCIIFGLLKILRPKSFLSLREKHPWVNVLDIYSFIFKTRFAERAVVINGYLLLLIGIGLAGWVLWRW